MSVRVFLLGRFEVFLGEVPIPAHAWRRRRPADLLKRVALAPGRALAREQLIDELWPDKDPESGANNLHRALHDLRQTLDGRWLVPDKGVIRLDSEVWVDASMFEELAARGDSTSLAKAVELYRGDLCPDDPYGDFLDPFRASLRARFIDVALRLSRQHTAAGDDASSIDILRRILGVDAAHEEAHRGLISALARAGRRAEALAQYGVCEQALSALGFAPSVQTTAVQRAIRDGELTTARPPSAPTWYHAARRLLGVSELSPLQGRDRELAALNEFLGSTGGSLWLVGEPGVGKTRLGVELTRLASERDMPVLCCVCLEHEAVTPYAPFLEMWNHHLRSHALPSSENPFFAFSPGEGGELYSDQLRLFEAVERALGAIHLTESVPLIIVDDVQLADRSTLDLCRYLVRASATRPLYLAFTCREDSLTAGSPLAQLYGDLAHQRLTRRLTVARLDRDASDALFKKMTERDHPELASNIYVLAGGNPFYIEELARAAGKDLDSQNIEPLLPEDLTELVTQRVAHLGRTTETLFVAAAVLGHRFRFDVATRLAGLTVADALTTLDRAIVAGLVEEVEEVCVFRHALVREALYRALTRARRTHLHARAAETLESALGHGTEVERVPTHEQIAWHWTQAGTPRRAIVHLVTAGDHAAKRVGLRNALHFYEQALALEPEPKAEFELLVKLGHLHIGQSAFEDAIQRFDAALRIGMDDPEARPSSSARARAQLGSARALLFSGNLAAADERLQASIRELEGLPPGQVEAAALFYHESLLRWSQGRVMEAIGAAERSLEHAEKSGDIRSRARAHEALVMAAHASGDWRLGVEHDSKRHALVGPAVEAGEMFEIHLCFWDMQLYDGQGRVRARQMVDTTERRALDLGAQRIAALCTCVGGSLAEIDGNSGAAEAGFRQASTLFAQVGAHAGEAEAQQRLATMLTLSGRLEEARHAVEVGQRASQRASGTRAHISVRLCAAKARLEIACGNHDAARAALNDGDAAEARHGRCMTCSLLLLQERVRLGLVTQDFALADGAAGELEQIAERFGSIAWRGMARLARARLFTRQSKIAEAQLAFEEAASAYREAGCTREAEMVQKEASAL